MAGEVLFAGDGRRDGDGGRAACAAAGVGEALGTQACDCSATYVRVGNRLIVDAASYCICVSITSQTRGLLLVHSALSLRDLPIVTAHHRRPPSGHCRHAERIAAAP